MLFHLFGAGRVSGGIDVFLVISGFLLTRSISRKMDQNRRFLPDHFGRVLIRLAPSALVVIGFSAVATLLIAPPSRWAQSGRELLASTLYYENWELISSQLAYGAAGINTSPLQHFWSLSVQGQFFLIWPFALMAIAGVAHFLGWKKEHALRIAVLIITLASFTYAMFLVNADQSVAYLNTWTRVWELGVGSLLAFFTLSSRIPELQRNLMAWSGLLLIVSCGFVIDGATAFPGPLTLWPVLGTALVIVGAGGTSRLSPIHALRLPPVTFLSKISYPLYLWHWPLLIFYLEYRHYGSISWKAAAGILALSITLAWLTQSYIAEPAMKAYGRNPIRRSVVASIGSVALVAAVLSAGVLLINSFSERQLDEATASSADHPGARTLTEDLLPVDSSVNFVPSTAVAERDIPDIYERGCVQNHLNEPGTEAVLVCSDEDTINPSKYIIMSGGSHVLHWYPALKAVAAQENWQIDVVDKDGCRLAVASAEDIRSPSTCSQWNVDALETLIGMQPDAVFTIGTTTPSDGDVESYSEAQVAAWAELADANVPVIAIRDTPRFSFRVPECVEENDGDYSACSRPRTEIFLDPAPIWEAENLPDGTAFLDLTDAFCTTTTCDAVIGNVLVYRDDDHMTATYSRTLESALLAELRLKAGWLF